LDDLVKEGAAATPAAPAIGSSVPDFTAQATGGPVSLATLRGKTVVLYFYPKDSTPGCTTETREFGDAHEDFAAAGAVVYGISRDSIKSHLRFKEALDIPFELISDPDEHLCNAFGVMKNKTMYGKPVRGVERSTFVVGRDGRLAKAWRAVKVPEHVAEVLAAVRGL
jgi:peroxiredoxin Q/BCP